MSNIIQVKLPEYLSSISVKRLMSLLNNSSESSKFVGGCVRDFLIGKNIRDVDIATQMNIDSIVDILLANKYVVNTSGKAFGSVKTMCEGMEYNITILRSESYDGSRYPNITPTKAWKTDATRRDFTINAIYCNADGVIYDYYNGLADLNSGIVRFIGNPIARIEEDPIRVLRYFRMLGLVGTKNISQETFQACVSTDIEILKKVSKAKIIEEMVKIVDTPHATQVLEIMLKHKILRAIGLDVTHLDLFTALLQIEVLSGAKLSSLTKLAAVMRSSVDNGKDLIFACVDDNRVAAVKMIDSLCVLALPNKVVDYKATDNEHELNKAVLGAAIYSQIVLLDWAYHKYKNPDSDVDAYFKKIYNMCCDVKTYDIPEISKSDIISIKHAILAAGTDVSAGEIVVQIRNVWNKTKVKINKQELISKTIRAITVNG